MLRTGVDIRIKETGAAGVLLDYEPGDLVCGVELNSAFLPADGNMEYQHYRMHEIEEVHEVVGKERKNVAEHFDLVLFSSFCFNRYPDCSNFAILKQDDGLYLRVFNYSQEVDKEVLLDEEGEKRLRSEFGKMKSFSWSKVFEPEYEVLDGYNWTMKVFPGGRFYRCEGNNKEPDELIDFCLSLAKFGVPAAWSIDEGPFIVGDEKTE